MVEKKLNFNQPILSVRRNSPSKIIDQRKISNSLPLHRSESKSDPVRNPGSIPFVWEWSPGRPKEEILAQHKDSHLASSKIFDESSEAVEDELELDANSPKPINLPDFSEYFAAKRRHEKGEQRRKVVNQDKPVLLHCKPKFDNCVLNYDKEEREGSGRHENVITVCCSLPRSRLKSSVCNVNPATSVMNRVMTFPASRIFSGASLSTSSTDGENEHAVKTFDKIKVGKEDLNKPLFLEVVKKHPPRRKSFKTLQELLADEGGLKWLDCVEKTIFFDTVKKLEDDNEDSDRDSSSEEEDLIRVAVKEAAKNAKQQLSRAATLGNTSVVSPPLPESPSDSWLSRTVSMKKASKSTSISRFSNNQN